MVEEISVKCLWVGGDSLFCVSMCCHSIAIHMLLQGGRRDGNHRPPPPMLPTKLIICCCSMAERWLPTLATILIMCAVISISLDLLKRSWLAGNLQQMPTVTSWLQILDTSFFCARIQALMQWWDRWLNVNCEYVEVSCVLSAPCVPCMHWSQNKVLSFEVFVTLCFWNSFVENC